MNLTFTVNAFIICPFLSFCATNGEAGKLARTEHVYAISVDLVLVYLTTSVNPQNIGTFQLEIIFDLFSGVRALKLLHYSLLIYGLN